MINKDIIIQELKKVKPILSQKYGLTELALFGSFSRNEETDLSDIDIMVNFKNSMGLNYFDMVYDLEEIFREKKVQVVSRGGIKPKYFERIKEDLIYA
jgi:hypothetical protein